MHLHPARRFVAVPVLAALMIVAVGCGSPSHSTASKSSSSATATMSATAAACRKIQTKLAQAPSTLGNLALHPSSAKATVSKFTDQLKQEAATADNAALTTAINDFSASVQKALASLQSNPGSISSLISQLTKDSQKIANACKSAVG